MAKKSIIQSLIYSLLVHALFVALPVFFLVPKKEITDGGQQRPIRVRITSVETASSGAKETNGEAPQKAASVRKSEPKGRAPKVAASKGGVIVAADVAVEKPAYSDLFPQYSGGALDQVGVGSESGGLEGAGSYDPEGDGFSFDDRARNLARLEGFARELSERISVPGALKELEPSGKAFLRYSRKKDGWKIAAVNGDPYYRALLYEVMDRLSKNSQAYHLLTETDYDSVRIYFSFRTASSLDQTVKPLVTKTDTNKVYIEITYQEAGAAWKIAMPQTDDRGNTKVGVDLLGVGLMAYKAVKNDDPGEDIEARKLRLSPAFARPIGR